MIRDIRCRGKYLALLVLVQPNFGYDLRPYMRISWNELTSFDYLTAPITCAKKVIGKRKKGKLPGYLYLSFELLGYPALH